MNYESLSKAPRILLEAPLQPVQGDRFQPTGFADIGAAEYSRPSSKGTEGTPMLLVESAQSVANRLERTCLGGDGPDVDPELAGLPYLRAELKGAGADALATSSLVEPHRLASPYFLKSDFAKSLASEMGYDGKGALDWKKIYAVLCKYDPNCLIHGVFLSLLGDGRVRVARALSGFIEAANTARAVSGGVKNSPIDPKGEIQVAGSKGEKGIYSNVPYSRTEYVAEKITAFFNLDVGQIKSYGLSEDATKLLIALSLLKVRRFLASDLRLRTACNLSLAGEVRVTAPADFQLPAEEDLMAEVKRLLSACQTQFAQPPVTRLEVAVTKVKTEKRSAKEAEGQEPKDDNN